MTVVLGPGRAKELDIEQEQMVKRMTKLETTLDEPLTEVSMYLAEGQAMSNGMNYRSGSELAYTLVDMMKFSIAYLMEKGYLGKTLPKQKSKDDKNGSHPGTYI